jgi:hypothetical protein
MAARRSVTVQSYRVKILFGVWHVISPHGLVCFAGALIDHSAHRLPFVTDDRAVRNHYVLTACPAWTLQGIKGDA